MPAVLQLQPALGPSGADLHLVQYLGRRLPEFRGKYRLVYRLLGRLVRQWPSDTTVVSNQNVAFLHCDLQQHIYRTLFVFGVYEPDVGWMGRRLLRPGDTVVDVGACFGYHSLDFAARVAPGGRLYAFEPQAGVFALLQQNLRANSLANVQAECMALSDGDGALELHCFPDLDVGYASITNRGRRDARTITCRAQTLDSYLKQHHIPDVTLLKLDVEGAELLVLRGASTLLGSPRPPMWIIEINRETAAAAGYRPEDLLCLLHSYGYTFYRPVWGKLLRTICRLERCDAVRHGENILCAVADVHRERLATAGTTP